MKNNFTPPYLSALIPQQHTTGYNLRNPDTVHIPLCRLTLYSNSRIPHTIPIWNNLAAAVRQVPSIASFKISIRPVHSKNPNFISMAHGDYKFFIFAFVQTAAALTNIFMTKHCWLAGLSVWHSWRQLPFLIYVSCLQPNSHIPPKLCCSILWTNAWHLSIWLLLSRYELQYCHCWCCPLVYQGFHEILIQLPFHFGSTFSLLRMFQNKWIPLGIRFNGLLF